MSVGGELRLPASAEVPFVGRTKEVQALEEGLRRVARGLGGECWVVEGPGGAGKTRLARTIAEASQRSGFSLRWAYCQRESPTPLFPWEQIFRPAVRDAGEGRGSSLPEEPSALPAGLLFVIDGAREASRHAMVQWSRSGPLLLVSRESPALLRQRHPDFASEVRFLHLSRLEGARGGPKVDLDGLGDELEGFWRTSPQGVVAFEGLEYLVSRESFLPVLNFLQFLRDLSERGGGHLVLFSRSASFEPRELTLLGTLGTTVRTAPRSPDPAPPPAPAGGPRSLPQRLLDYLDRLEKAAAQAPQLLVLDDLQWADGSSLQAFEFLVRNARTLPVLFLALVRSEEEEGPSSRSTAADLGEVLDRLEGARWLHRLPLLPLPESSASELLAGFLGAPLTGQGREELLGRAEGNPYYLLATARMLAEEGALRLRSGKFVVEPMRGDERAIPQGIRRVVARRLSMLSASERELLEAAAVLGRVFDPQPLAQTFDRGKEGVLPVLRRLETAHRFLEGPSEEADRWSFTHPLTWEAVRAETDPERGRHQAAELAHHAEGDRPDQVESAARLYHAALRPDPGLRWVRDALDLALKGNDTEVVERQHGWLQDLLQAAGASPGARVEEGSRVLLRMMLRMGSGLAAAERMGRFLGEEGRELPEGIPAEILLCRCLMGRRPQEVPERARALAARIAQAQGRVPLDFQGLWASVQVFGIPPPRWPESVELARRALQEPGVRGLPATGHYLRYQLAYTLLQLGRREESREAIALLEAPAPGRTPSFEQALRAGIESALAYGAGNLRETTRLYDLSSRTALAIGDLASAGVARSNAVSTAQTLGDWPLAEAYLRELGELADRFDLPRARMAFLAQGADMERARGRWDTAREGFDRVLEAIRQTGDTEFLAAATIGLVEVLLRTGDLARAERELTPQEKASAGLLSEEQANLLLLRGLLEEAQGSASSRASFEKGLAMSRTLGVQYLVGCSHAMLSGWERAHGSEAKEREHRAEARRLFDQAGISEEAQAYQFWFPSPKAP